MHENKVIPNPFVELNNARNLSGASISNPTYQDNIISVGDLEIVYNKLLEIEKKVDSIFCKLVALDKE